jgi:hypothetical protein
MKQLNRFACALALGAMAAFTVACGGDEEDPIGGTPDAGGGLTGSFTHHVNTELKFGTSGAEAMGLAFADLDGKGATKDNFLGTFLANLNGQLMIDMALKSAVDDGTIVILHSIRADDLANDPTAQWQVWLGKPQAMPKFDGTGMFEVAANAPTDAKIAGSITGGKFSGKASKVTLEISLVSGTQPLRINLNAPHIEANVTANGCTNGRLAGAIALTELNDVIIPALAMQFDGRLGADSGCRTDINMCEQGNKLLRTLFDTNPNDGMITVNELRTNATIQLLLQPDVDVLLANGNAGQDNMLESLSATLGFSCAKGTYTAPGEQ